MTTVSRHHSSSLWTRKASARMRLLFVCLLCLLLIVALLSWFLPSTTTTSDSNSYFDSSVSFAHGHNNLMPALRSARLQQDRIAILLPFVGQAAEFNRYSAPAYLALFCAGAVGAAEVADFFIFHNGVLDTASTWDCPNNVKFIDLESSENFARHLLRVLDQKEEADLAFESKDQLIQLVAKHLYVYPYCLVEFKPALGHVFADYITDYSHWGYSDLDMLYGDLGRWITPDEMTDFDIVTYSFGDQHRLYLRGQLTFHRNNAKITQLWRGCDYLSHLDKRLSDVVNHKSKYRFESAEGCYSAAILERDDVRVKYASKAWTDVHGKDTAYSHGVYLARDLHKNRHVIYKASGHATGRILDTLSHDWFNHDKIYRDRSQPLQKPLGAMEPLTLPDAESASSKCMYWVQQKYQSLLCLDETAAGKNDTIYWVDGQLFKQSHANMELETDVSTAPFFHFQEWKRYYRPAQLASLHTSSPINLFMLSKEGAIPLARSNAKIQWSVFSNGVASPLQLPMNHWSSTHEDRNMLPSQSYCLLSGRRKVPPQPPTSQCHFASSWRDKERVEVVSQAPLWMGVTVNSDITLVMTLQITKAQANHRQSLVGLLDIAAENLDRWQGEPAVLLLHISGMTDQVKSFLKERFGTQSDLEYGTSNALVAVIYQEEDIYVSRKALLNMASDAVPTRWYISGIELERGLIFSEDASYFAQRMLLTHGNEGGSLYLIPQFALDGNSKSLSLSELRDAKINNLLKPPASFDEVCDDGSVHNLTRLNEIWWSSIDGLLDLKHGRSANATGNGQLAIRLLDLEFSLMELLTDASHMAMFALDESPILLTDNLSPRNGLRSDELVRQVEELGGRRCYNGLRLAQFAALQYRLHALPGVFALSTKYSRSATRGIHDYSLVGLSRCDGCFMFGDDEHEDVLEDIIKDEIVRPAKTAVLWNERQ